MCTVHTSCTGGEAEAEAVEVFRLGVVPSRNIHTVKQHAAGIRHFVQSKRVSCDGKKIAWSNLA